MYEAHFNLETLPFGLTPNTQFFCDLPTHHEALNTVLFALKSGEGFIKIVGEVGTGKTLICRKVLNMLPAEFVTAYIPNPLLSAEELSRAIAAELKIPSARLSSNPDLIQTLQQELIALHKQNKKVVLIIDEAQVLSDSVLEAIRLLTNLETEATKLLQVVLFGQPELDEKLQQAHLRQLKQRITFSYHLKKITKGELPTYLNYRLFQAGYRQQDLFTHKSLKMLNKASGGIPRLINILAHKSMLVAYGNGDQHISHKAMQLAINDTESVKSYRNLRKLYLISIGLCLAAIIGIWWCA